MRTALRLPGTEVGSTGRSGVTVAFVEVLLRGKNMIFQINIECLAKKILRET